MSKEVIINRVTLNKSNWKMIVLEQGLNAGLVYAAVSAARTTSEIMSEMIKFVVFNSKIYKDMEEDYKELLDASLKKQEGRIIREKNH